ncbi:hypothetical protein M407DRAFT_33325 [Tulasnella calospora MUT 4182]|uniref:Uncharacterized protein n=1 Tax=Tulasnella calospora MUT 4182 TaxID=1051891 RepID=A0A0C3Q388_9AGAM|nr:hypothetical protein M407DRAFT_33325 [Tulasnella calospora MUT 4182]
MSRQAQYTSISTVEQDGQFETAPALGTRTSTKPSEGPSYPGPSYSKAKSTRKLISPILKPVCILLFGGLLAIGHHLFNAHADGKLMLVYETPVRTSHELIGPYTSPDSEIDQVYLVADKDTMATFFSLAILRSPLLVTAAALSFLLPIPTVLTPSSLQVTPHTVSNWSPCQVPTGNVMSGGPGSVMYQTGGWGYWAGVTPVAQKLALSTFVGQKIPPLPQSCGLNCTYSVTVPSIAFRCQEAVELPAATSGNQQLREESFWNSTTTEVGPSPNTSFYVYWKSTEEGGTNGTALCTVGTAQYHFTVQTTNGQQFVTYNVTQTGDLVNTKGSNHLAEGITIEEWNFAMQLSSIAAAARSLLLGTVSITHGVSGETPIFDSSITSASFFDPSLNSGTSFIWGDVPRGIEQLSHNISAAILTMDLGVQDSSCFVTKQDIIYQYDRLSLWLPYGVTLLIVSLCMVVGIMVFLRLNPENLTSSFSNTVSITRNSSLDIFTQGDGDVADSKRHSRLFRFKLGELKDGRTGFGMHEDFKLE